MMSTRYPQPFVLQPETAGQFGETEEAMAPQGAAIVNLQGVQFQSWRQEDWLEYKDSESAEKDGFYTIAKLRQAYPHQCTRIAGPGHCNWRTCIQCQIQKGEEWNPQLTQDTQEVKAMLRVAGRIREKYPITLKDGLDAQWPQGIQDILAIKDNLGKSLFKEITHWGPHS